MISIKTLRRLAVPVAVLSLQACGGGGADQDTAQAQGESRAQAQALKVSADPMSTGLVSETAGGRRNSGMAMNLASMEYWSTDFPTIDQFKRAGGWLTTCTPTKSPGCKDFSPGHDAWDTGENAKLDLDENGWVKSLPPETDGSVKYRHVTTYVFHGDHGAHPAGTYTVAYEGEGTIEYLFVNGVKRDPDTKHDSVDVAGGDESAFGIRITATNPNNHLRNIRVYPPGGVCSNERLTVVTKVEDCTGAKGSYIPFEKLSETQPWHPTFRAHLTGVRALRFMDWGRTNSSRLARWDDRPKKTDAFWTGPYGVPLGSMISLANSVQADAWINVPVYADEDYVRNAARTVKGQLNPLAQLIVEYGNEPWNGAFGQYGEMLTQATGKWGDPDKNGGTKHEWVLNQYAFRSAQVCDIVKQEFGTEAGRVKCALNSQAADRNNIIDVSLPCPKAAGDLGKECAKSIDVVAIAPYFGSYLTEGKERQNYIRDNWFKQSDGGLAKLFEEIRAKDANDRPVVPPMAAASASDKDQAGGALAESRLWVKEYKAALARKGYAQPLYAYEGGQHLVNHRRDCSKLTGNAQEVCIKEDSEFAPKWVALLKRANEHPLMGKAYSTMMADWQAEGGQAYAPFTFVYFAGNDGAWGLKQRIFDGDADSPKWQALLPYRDGACWWTGCHDLLSPANKQ